MKTENENNKAFVIEDLRNTENNTADFRLTHTNEGGEQGYVLLFKLNVDAKGVSLISFEDISRTKPTTEVVIPLEVCNLPVSKIGFSVFGVPLESDMGCAANELKKVVLPPTIKEIGSWAFGYCNSLEELKLPDSIAVIEEGAFYECESIKQVYISENVSHIGSLAFSGCCGLQSIIVNPNNIYYDSRDNCNAIIFTKENKLIAGCENTKIPESVIAIEGAFVGLWSLEKFVIPNHIHEIGEFSFKDCTSLEQIDIPNSVSHIGPYAFEGCCSLKRVALPNGIHVIGEHAFDGCADLEEATMPLELKTIGEKAFYNCGKLYKITLPDSVTTIGLDAFYNCQMLRKLYVPKSVLEIGTSEHDFLFYEGSMCWGSNRLLSIEVSKDNHTFDSRDNCNAIIESKTNTLLQGCNATIIPDSITRIGAGAFCGCDHLTSIIIPNSVNVIDDYAFSSCHDLESIVIPSSVTKIGTRAFAYCQNLEIVAIPDSVQEIGIGAFLFCENLKKIFIKDASLLKDSDVSLAVEIIKQEPSLFDGVFVQETVNNNTHNNELESLKASEMSWIDWIELDPGASCFGSEISFMKSLSSRLKLNDIAFHKKLTEKIKLQPQLIKFESFGFDQIINRVRDDASLDNPQKSFGKVVYDVMDKCIRDLYKTKFIKYLNFYNKVELEEMGGVGFYADFIHSLGGVCRLAKGKKLFTDNADAVDIGTSVELVCGDELIVEELFRSGDTTKTLFEYTNCYTKDSLIGDDEYYSLKFNGNRYKYVFSEDLAKFVYNKGKNRVQKINHYLEQLDNCYYEYGNGVTNHFFFIGSSKRSFVADNDFNKYIIRASLGIDRSRVDDEKTIELFLREFRKFISDLSSDIINRIKEYRLLQTAKKAAVAQVMARNMSHNLGSHVFSNLINQDAYLRISDNEVLQSDNYLSSFDCVDKSKNDTDTKNLQISYFNQYLKSRMDYLSEVTFGISNMITTKYMYSDVFKELDRVRILLNYISGIQGFKYTICLKRNGTVLSNENDIAIAFPSDVLGNQAFYNIIENVIRNTAKHACNNKQKIVTFTIEFNDIEDYPESEYYCVEIDNGIEELNIDELVKKQNKRINTSVLDKDNNLRNHSLGLLEMKASAAFLRQVDIAKVDSYDYHFDDGYEYKNAYDNLILMKAINKNGALGYRFFMQKPKEILLVGNWGIDDSKKEELLTCGIKIVDENEFVMAMEKGIPFAHPFLLYHHDVTKQVEDLLSDDNACKTLLPVRKLKLEKENANHIIKIINQDAHKEIGKLIKDSAWAKYYENEIAKDLKNPDNIQINVRPGFDPNRGKDGFIPNQVVFLNHSFKDTHNRAWQQVCDAKDFEAWIENLSSRTSIKLPEFSKNSLCEDDSDDDSNPVSDYIENIKNVYPIKYEIFEAYHNKVVVLDERVQKYFLEGYEGPSGNNGGPIPCSELFKSTNVYVPETPLAPNSFTQEAKLDLECFIDNNLEGNFLLVHYGLLERLYDNETTITNKLNGWAEKAKRVVVTSGRGAHSLPLPPTVCFVNLSSVLYAFTENRNKFIINCLLNQSRRKYE